MPESGSVRRTAVRVARHLRWARRQGVGRLIEEDQLDPRARARAAAARRRWVREHPGVAPNAVPVFLLGAQRSGTNMLVRGFESSPSFDACNENDRRAFVRFRLRPLPEIRALVEGSPHRHLLCKPLAESHRALELLDELGTRSHPRVLWAYRHVDGRIRSAVAKFGPNNLLALRAIVEDGAERGWSVQGPAQEVVDLIRDGLTEESLTLVRSFDYERLDAEAGAALFWYVRNRVYFDLGLHDRDDVMLSSYDRMVADPQATMRSLCTFLDVPYAPELAAHVERRDVPREARVVLPGEIRRRCDELEQRLAAAVAERERAVADGGAAGGATAEGRR